LNLYSEEEILDSKSVIFDTESELLSTVVEEKGNVFEEKQAEGVEEDWEGVTRWKVDMELVSLYIAGRSFGSTTFWILISISGALEDLSLGGSCQVSSIVGYVKGAHLTYH
jgi:hypothetical protein